MTSSSQNSLEKQNKAGGSPLDFKTGYEAQPPNTVAPRGLRTDGDRIQNRTNRQARPTGPSEAAKTVPRGRVSRGTTPGTLEPRAKERSGTRTNTPPQE